MENKDSEVGYEVAEKIVEILMKHDKKCSYEIRESMKHFEFVSNSDIATPIKTYASGVLNINFEPCQEYSDKINFLNLGDIDELCITSDNIKKNSLDTSEIFLKNFKLHKLFHYNVKSIFIRPPQTYYNDISLSFREVRSILIMIACFAQFITISLYFTD